MTAKEPYRGQPDDVCNDCSHYLDMHGDTGCECCTCEVGREPDTDEDEASDV